MEKHPRVKLGQRSLRRRDGSRVEGGGEEDKEHGKGDRNGLVEKRSLGAYKAAAKQKARHKSIERNTEAFEQG